MKPAPILAARKRIVFLLDSNRSAFWILPNIVVQRSDSVWTVGLGWLFWCASIGRTRTPLTDEQMARIKAAYHARGDLP